MFLNNLVHTGLCLANVPQQLGIMEHVHRGLIVEQDPCAWDCSGIVCLKYTCPTGVEKLESTGEVAIKFSFRHS